ncbi:MAG: bifunctional hydroxymethylpyrimidine kinase/phosphomethylpyrimidine kinase [Clostridia bacterium]|nr:bifunctional hydroxymethylpyrimidine kinase/phosphomethylpyrimidine kinase [Clostridia bacterium]
MDKADIRRILENAGKVTVCLAGDICLDAYWLADMKKSRLSRETPHFPLPVTQERYSLGGGGNAAANFAALGVKNVMPVSVIGDDWRAVLVKNCLAKSGIDGGYVVADAGRVTPCYCKPLRSGISDTVYEDPRLDFENYSPLSEETEEKLLATLKEAAEKADIIAVCDQLEYGVITPKIRECLCEIAKKKPVVADSRDRTALYKNAIIKPNDVEAAAALGTNATGTEAAAKTLSEKTGAPVIITEGAKGAVWCEGGKTVFVPALKTEPPVDTVGAGDTFLAAFCAAYAAGESGEKAVEFANLACAVTVKKIGVTGTASPEEILALA